MIIIGICGGSGSGKTTIAKSVQNLMSESKSTLLAQDSYYNDLGHLSDFQRSITNFDHPSALDWQLMEKHLLTLKSGKAVETPCYDFVSHTRQGSVRVDPKPFIILEGHLIFYPAQIRSLIDLKIFLSNQLDILLCRRILRDIVERGRNVSYALEQYIQTVRPMYFNYVIPCEKYADITISSDGSVGDLARAIVENLESKFK
jgi:uridine kinase